ncbi:MAG: sodium/proton-translocating pyrophosphatase [Desulfosudis oleivorans]|nr:sodium/proton-translocating pyrophosphatase [Desulfosudis oleivorans]
MTGVALIAFLALALAASPTMCATLIVWLFVMRALMIVTSLVSYFVNEAVSKAMFGGKKDFDFEAPLTHLVWITSAVSIVVTFVASKLLLGDFGCRGAAQPALWWVLSVIISCGTVAGALIPEFTKIFTSTNSRHVRRSRQLLQARRRLAEHPVRLRGRQLLAPSGWAWSSCCSCSSPITSPEPGAAGHHADGVRLRRADLRLRPGGLRLPRHGPGDHRGGQLRPGHGQRPVRL